MLITLFLLQAASAEIKPDIELNIHARAKSVEIQQKGQATLRVSAEPDAGSAVEATVTPEANGRTQLRNVTVDVRGAARLGESLSVDAAAQAEPAPSTGPETREPD
ncbi:hypothetical protein E2493_10235 [Sphingomonas parva]|uniref:Uncharacterized protein n=1 Tax=Sphingomonas parva TaxID=2555898 RepID=A0A4Y8ZV71_9SPHN|nr:hypothetical protein [Sphingomonas parva]TFI58356.1 hypothetical protein E2493_10235 [Sphingomonas parva]